MTKHPTCPYGDDRDGAIVEYLYGECDPGARSAFDTHLAACAACAADIRALRGVRQALAGWAPPEPMRALDHAPMLRGPRLTTVVPAAGPETSGRPALTSLPAWARAAAAVLCLGVGLGAANLRVTYSPEGLSVRTGWLDQGAPANPVAVAGGQPAAQDGRGVAAAADAATVAETSSPSPWRGELTALAEELRGEIRATASHGPAAADRVSDVDLASHDAALLRQVKALIQRSEERQQGQMAVRVNTVLNDLQAQRRADLGRIERTIGVVQNNTGMEVLRQQQMINSLAVRVSTAR